MRRLLKLLLICFVIIFSGNLLYAQKQFIPKKIVFGVESRSDESFREVFRDSINSLLNKYPVDTLERFSEILLRSLDIEESKKKEIVISYNRDTIWQATLIDDVMIGDFKRINSNGMVFLHPKNYKNIVYDSLNYFQGYGSRKYILTENKLDTKEILGYECYKVVFKLIEDVKDEQSFDLGLTIYEMYVTDKINLPIHSLIFFSKNFKGIFPLEVKHFMEKMPGAVELYRAKFIEK